MPSFSLWVRRALALALALPLPLSGLALVSPAVAATTPAAPAIAPAKPLPGQAITASGSLRPASPKVIRPVTLQRQQGARWVAVTTGSTTAAGTYALKATAPKTPGPATYRLFVKALTTLVQGKRTTLPALTSRVRTITIATPDTIPPPVPTGLVATPGNGQAGLVWSAVTGRAAADLAGYRVYRAPSASGPWTIVTAAPQAGTTYAASGLTNGIAYWFAVASVDITGNTSARSAAASVTPIAPDTTPPPVPAGLVATPGNGEAGLAWGAVTGSAATDLAGYRVYRAPSADGPWTTLTDTPQAGTAYTATGLTNGTPYWFAVASVDTTGNTSARSIAASTTPDRDASPHHCGTLDHDQVWKNTRVHTLDCAVVVPDGITLTVQPGTVVKSSEAALTVEGTLVAGGSPGAPVWFTSLADDSVGGDTNGDGDTTAPEAGDWPGIAVADGGTADVDSTYLSYADRGIDSATGDVSFTRGWANDCARQCVRIDSADADRPAIHDDVFTDFGKAAVGIRAAVDLSLLAHNEFDGHTGTGAVTFNGATVTATGTYPDSSGPIALAGTGLTIADGITATLVPGTVVKGTATDPTEIGGGTAGVLTVMGTLHAEGTDDQPIAFTSLADDTAGGDTNGDGHTTSAQPGDWAGITVAAGGAVALDHAVAAYADRVIDSASGTVTFTHGSATECVHQCLRIVSGDTDEPTISDSRFSGYGLAAVAISAHVDLARLGLNTFFGSTGIGAVAFDGATVTATGTYPAGSGPLALTGAGLTVADGVTATLPAGTLVKATTGGITVEGTLVADGTSDAPVELTSLADDSAHGDTNGDADAAAPAPGDWSGITVASGGTVHLGGTMLQFADRGIDSATGNVSFVNGWAGECARQCIRIDSADTHLPTVSGNTFSPSGLAALSIHASVDLDLLGGNQFDGPTGVGAVTFDGATVTATSTYPTDSGPIALTGSGLTIADGITATLPGGTVVKGGTGGVLTVDGTLLAPGTVEAPVVFTSLADDSFGDTNGDQHNSTPQRGDWTGIAVAAGGSVDLSSATLQYADRGIDSASGDVIFTDGLVGDCARQCIRIDAADAVRPTVSGTIFAGFGKAAVAIRGGVDLGRLGGNEFQGSTGVGAVTFNGATVTATSTYPADSGPIALTGAGLAIAAGITATLSPGTLVKGSATDPTEIACCSAGALTVAGTLVAHGTAELPVVFTSLADDSFGDTNGDGNASTPQPDDWTGIVVTGSGTTDLSGFELYYASTPL